MLFVVFEFLGARSTMEIGADQYIYVSYIYICIIYIYIYDTIFLSPFPSVMMVGHPLD